MFDREFVNIGDIIPIYVSPSGPGYMRIRNTTYGVVIGFTISGNPRVYPIYYKMVQDFKDWKEASKQIRQLSYVLMESYPIDNREAWLDQGNRRKNYNNVLKIIIDEQDKNFHKDVSIGTQKKANSSGSYLQFLGR